jgi:DNA replication licensing factor MCM5
MQQDEDSSRQAPQFSMEEVEAFKEFARKPAAQQRIFDMIAPQIYGSEQIKKAIACLLFGGSRKVRIKITNNQRSTVVHAWRSQ